MDSPRSGLFRPRCSWVLIVLICYSPSVVRQQHAFADEPTDTGSISYEVEALIEQLSSSTFATREMASKRLLEIGAPSLELLRKARQHTELEVRERSNRICEQIDSVLFEKITKKFILSADGAQGFGLPAWDVFRSISGDSRTSKLLFVTMLRSQNDLAVCIEAVSKAKGAADLAMAYEQLASKAAAAAERLRNRSDLGELPAVGDTIGLLVACSVFNDTLSITSVSNEVNEVVVGSLYRPALSEYFNKAGYGRCMRALTGRWISKTQASLAKDVLSIAMQLGIPEGANVARRHLDASSDSETRVYALQCLARFGNEADIASVSKLLNEELIIFEFPDQSAIGAPRDDIREDNIPPPGSKPSNPPPPDFPRMIVRLNDVALAVCMTLGSEDLTKTFPKYVQNESNGILLVDCAFPSDGQELHKRAIARWQQEHPQFVEKTN